MSRSKLKRRPQSTTRDSTVPVTNHDEQNPPVRLLSKLEVLDRVGVTYPTIWSWMGDGLFPLGPVYYAPAPVYVEEPACRLVRERFWDGYGWQFRRVQVCD
jgi:hypothetical protein